MRLAFLSGHPGLGLIHEIVGVSSGGSKGNLVRTMSEEFKPMLLKRWYDADLLGEEISRLQQEMSRWFGSRTPAAFPLMNIWRAENQVLVDVELPGVQQADVEVLVTPDNQLVVSGQRRQTTEEGCYRRERRFGEFSRTVTLPVEVDPEQVTACLKNGILQIRLAEKVASEPRKIEVRNGA